MKKLALTLLVLMLIPTVLASKGVGISWTQESAIFPEAQKSCLSYGVYNPFDKDVEITLSAEGDIKELNPKSENAFVPAGTMHGNDKEVNICFDIPRMYKSCKETERILDGKIVAREAPSSISGGTGSATVAMASVPLKIKVTCNPMKINPVIIFLLVAAVIIGAAIYFRKKK